MLWSNNGGSERDDAPTFVSPFAKELFAGYQRWQHIDDGSMWRMMQPGATGIGIHVGQLIEPDCCFGGYGPMSRRTVRHRDTNTPWLFPSLVEWSSVMHDNFPKADFIRMFDVDYPVVAINRVESPVDDFRWAMSNINYEFNPDRFSYEPNDELLEIEGMNIIGLVPLWSVIPLNPDANYLEAFKETVRKMGWSEAYNSFQYCFCTAGEVDCDEDCPRNKDWKQDCKCNAAERSFQEVEKLYVNPTPVNTFMEPQILRMWNHAVERFYDGWQVIHDTVPIGEQWASYWQQAQSPFLDLLGQSSKDLEGLIA